MSDVLEKKVKRLKRIFDIDEILKQQIDYEYIKSYYKINRLAYTLFHSHTNFVHMGVSNGDKFSDEDLEYYVRYINKLIEDNSFTSILELATGRGANSIWLAERNPDASFVALDLSPAQLDIAFKTSKYYSNIYFKLGDFHSLNGIQDNSVEICFIIEALCYSDNYLSVLEEVLRVLKPGGYFVVADGYLAKPVVELSDIELITKRLVEFGMAVNDLKSYDRFIDDAKAKGLNVVREEDVSLKTVPTMRRFESLAKKFLDLGLITRFLVRILPKKFLYNIFSGYLLPDVMIEGIGSYMITTFRKS